MNTTTTKPVRWKGWHLANGKPHWHAFPSTFHVVIERANFMDVISSHNKICAARRKQKKEPGSFIIRCNLRPCHNDGGIQHVPWTSEEGRVDEVYAEDLSWFDSL